MPYIVSLNLDTVHVFNALLAQEIEYKNMQ